MGMSIAAAARLIGRSPITLARWEARGHIRPRRDRAGHRIYSAADIQRLRELAATIRPGRAGNTEGRARRGRKKAPA
ncbi:MAG: MerR family transcriptional regulator [Gammaproteobacteria bacterium]